MDCSSSRNHLKPFHVENSHMENNGIRSPGPSLGGSRRVRGVPNPRDVTACPNPFTTVVVQDR